VTDSERWVFNKMADVYESRPPYPDALVNAIWAFCSSIGPSVCDLGAGVGHLALPLARRGLDVVAVEPAQEMLARLTDRAKSSGLNLSLVHAAAESMPLANASIHVAIIADALHFLDAELTGRELRRVLAARAGLALVTCELADTPFMRALVEVMTEAAPRRPRGTVGTREQLAALAGVTFASRAAFHDDTPVDRAGLERILRSISFIGPAMNEARFAEFRARIQALPYAPVWSRDFTLTLLRNHQ
jgi:ubiquinone/menaquinone biosynthesis C-methylase UbiE